MKRSLTVIATCIATILIAACESQKQEEANDAGKQSVVDFNGQWKTELMAFKTDRCAMRADFSNDGGDFVVGDFTIGCVAGGTEGLYLPLRLKILSREQFTADELFGLQVPATAQVLALDLTAPGGGIRDLRPRGWIDISSPSVHRLEIAIQGRDAVLYNSFHLKAEVKAGGALEVQSVSMTDGWSVSDPILFQKGQGVTSDYLYGRSPWEKLSLPYGAVAAASMQDANFLYCVDRKSSQLLGIVHLSGTRYAISGGAIGEVGFIDRSGENRVYMWRTDSGSRSIHKGFVSYWLSMTGVGGRANYFDFEVADDGRGYLMSSNGYTRMLCRATVNDPFRGFIGWNPE